MKNVCMVVGLAVLVYVFCTSSAKVRPIAETLAERNMVLSNTASTDMHPTKEEWLEVWITHEIKDVTDLWRQRIAVLVLISQEEQVIVVGLSSATGQEEISQSAKKEYVQRAESIVKGILEEYDWAKDYQLTVHYI